jgi:Ca2+-binding RTX toxin-like protein
MSKPSPLQSGVLPLPAGALDLLDSWLQDFAQSPDLSARLRLAFDRDLPPAALEPLRQAWASGDYALPRIEVLDASQIGGAVGAYAAATNTIHLAAAFVGSQTSEAVALVLLEEYGHALDRALAIAAAATEGAEGIPPADAPGDEGQVFARLVAGRPMSAEELAALKAEDDSATATIGGAAVAIEQAVATTVLVTHASARHVFSINDIIGGFDGRTFELDPTIIDLAGTSGVGNIIDKNGDILSPIDSEFGFYVYDFLEALPKVRDYDYAEGWAGNITVGGDVVGLATVNAVTDTFKSGQPFGTWAAGLGGNSVKASTEHYEVMAALLSDQQYVGDPNAVYPLDDNLKVRGEFTIDGVTVQDPYVTDLLGEVGDVNGDGALDIRDVLQPNESTAAENIAYGDDYSVTLKDDGKLLYRWGTEIKRPNDIRMDAKLDLPEEWLNGADKDNDGTADVQEMNGGLGYRVTRAELIIAHDITNNPNDQIRPEDYENEGATGRGPSYYVVVDPADAANTLWVSPLDSYDGSGAFLPSYFRLTDTGEIDLVAQAGDVAVFDPDGNLVGYRNKDADGNLIGTVFRDLSRIEDTENAGLVFSSSDLEGGFTNAWYTTTDRDPFEWSYDKFSADPYRQVLVGFRSREEAEAEGFTDADLVSGPRWRLTSNKFGQDIPGVEIPLIANSQPPYQKDNIRYGVGEQTVTILNLLDFDDLNANGIADDSPLLYSTGWTLVDPTRLDLDLDGLIDEGWSQVNGTFGAGDAIPTGPILSAVTPNGQTLTPDFLDVAVYLKGDRQDSAKIYNMQLVLEYEADPTIVDHDFEAVSDGDAIFTVDPAEILPVLEGGSGGGGKPDPIAPDIDEPLLTAPKFRSSHVFSTADVTGTFTGLTQGRVAPDGTPVVDFSATPVVTKDGIDLFPVNSEFGYNVTDFVGAVEKDFVDDPEYAEGLVGDVKDEFGAQAGLVVSDAPTDTFLTPALLGNWLVGMGGDAVKADTEHYVVMQQILSDQRYPGDPDALYPLDDNLVLIGGEYDGQYVKDVLPLVGDVNGDGVTDIRDVLQPNENTITENIAVSSDYAVTLKDDGKLLYKWGNEIKKPNDVRIEATLDLPDEWSAPVDIAEPEVLPLFRITKAELVVRHTLTNNPNDQIRPEDYENEAATGTLPEYVVLPDGKWVTAADYYAGDGSFYPAGTVLRDPALAEAAKTSALAGIGAMSEDLLEGFTNAWYTTMNREPFEPVLGTDGYEVGPRWRLKADKYGQDLPGVVIPADPSLPPPPTAAEVKYEVGSETQTVINLLDWEGISPLSISAGWQNAAGTVSVNGLNRTMDFDVAFYIKGDIKPTTIYGAELLMDYDEVPIEAKGATLTGTDADDILAAKGGNVFTGGAGEDLFVLSYGTTDNALLLASVIEDFQVGLDRVGLIGLDVNDLNFAATVTQTLVGEDIEIRLDGHLIATVKGVAPDLGPTNALTIDDFMVLTTLYGQVGTNGADSLVGTADADEIHGLAGADTIDGLAGDDSLDGGADNDVLIGGTGADTFWGGDGDDVFQIDDSGDVVDNGGAGYDTAIVVNPAGLSLTVGAWQNVERIDGDAGNDTILANGMATDLYLTGGAGGDSLNGGAGNDTIAGGDGNDTMAGAAGNDVFLVWQAGDTIRTGGNGYDTVTVTNAGGVFYSVGTWLSVERIDGNAGNDTILANGMATDLYLAGGAGGDSLNGGAGADTIAGGDGNDTMAGAAGNDVFLVWQPGDTIRTGGEGYDTVKVTNPGGAAFSVGTWLSVERIDGNAGNDRIDATGMATGVMILGAGGADTLTGGSGADLFAFEAGFGSDVIAAFADGSDRLDFAGHADVDDLADLVIVQSGADTRITLAAGGSDQITLLAFTASALDASDFVFA